ncbi:alpha/beta hydrolase [Flaviflagellibacter deserti]|uniref:Alpha/beta hydrolase n=1 Tax=Flaviflagellibacter deserti TaxID=2267266 RepID=A0ABV9Z3E2_9HYPH
MESLNHIVTASGRRIALKFQPGEGPTVVWLGGFKSDMASTKASFITEWGKNAGRATLRFDYSGHGESEGRFEDGTISHWLEDALTVVRAHAGEAPILVGSSMGGWISLLAARILAAEGRTLSGLVLIAPAADFTEDLMWKRFTPAQKKAIEKHGVYRHPSEYSDEPTPITRALILDGRNHLILGAPFKVGAPVRILQGMQDPDVPWKHTMTLVEHLAEDDVVVGLIKDGDHRLSRPEDLDRLIAAIEAVGK